MNKVYNGAAVPRYQVFVLAGGEYVVQWNENSVQNLMTGQYRPYTYHDFGHLIQDFELERLKAAGVIEHYNRTYVWIYPLPEQNRFGSLRTQERTSGHVRLFYLNTTLPASRFDEVLDRFQSLNLMDQFWATEHDGVVAIFGKDEKPFAQLMDAESVQRQLSASAPDLFGAMAVAFIEMSRSEIALKSADFAALDLDAIIEGQSDTSALQGKRAVVIVQDELESYEICQQLGSLGMDVRTARVAGEALQILEEQSPQILLMELQLPDMHGYEMLAKVREMAFPVRVVVLAEPNAADSDQVFALTIAKVDGYLVKPISMPLLRQTVWEALSG